MQSLFRIGLLSALLVLACDAFASGSDLEREQRLADEIVDAIFDGEPIDLPRSDGNTFLGIYTESESDPVKGAVLILHGRGFHPDWATTVQPLRVGLIEHGWNTLSIQVPVLTKEAKYYDYVPVFPESYPRIETAIEYLKEQGNERIVLIAHSCGAHMAHFWFDDRGDKLIDAYVGLGMGRLSGPIFQTTRPRTATIFSRFF